MTWSIVARDPQTGRLAVAVTTCAFAVGARVPYGCGNVGAIATQSYVNPLYGIDGLRLLMEGRAPQAVIDILTAADPGASRRQVHLIDRAGRIAVHTGADCVGWCGSASADNVSVAGNMLAGADVVDCTLATWLARADLDFDDRLITALEAGQKAGGDKRGKQSAAVRIWGTEPFADFDIRVDDSEEPLAELRRLWRKAHQRYVPYQAASPTRENPAGLAGDDLDAACAAYTEAWNRRHSG